uniref:Uncharacterized protein n=1 Tax=Arundo donax TaxID=35708 RepID=A0A0A8ZKP0_ARUDO
MADAWAPARLHEGCRACPAPLPLAGARTLACWRQQRPRSRA